MTSEASTEPSRRKRFMRAAASDHGLTPLKLQALQLIAESKFLSTPQVAAIGGWSDRAARSHLRDLYDLGLVDVISVPGAVIGSKALIAAKVHYPTKEGLKVLEQWEMLPSHAARPAAYAPTKLSFIGHELAVRDMLVWLKRSERKHARDGHLVEQWNCSSHLTIPGSTTDAIFTYKFGPESDGPIVRGLVEVDMGTERGTAGNRHDRWAGKFEAYSALFSDKDRNVLFGLFGIRRARLVVTVPTRERADWVLRRSIGSVAAEFLWVAIQSDLANADVYGPIWLRPDGNRHSFIPPFVEKD